MNFHLSHITSVWKVSVLLLCCDLTYKCPSELGKIRLFEYYAFIILAMENCVCMFVNKRVTVKTL